MPKESYVTILAILLKCGEYKEWQKDGKMFKNRELTIVDSSKYCIDLTIWTDFSTNSKCKPGTIIFCKQAKIGDLNGKNLTAWKSESVIINPTFLQARRLSMWFQSAFKRSRIINLSESQAKGFSSIKDVKNMFTSSIVNVIRIIGSISEVTIIKTKQEEENKKREITIYDENDDAFMIVLQSDAAESFAGNVSDSIFAKNVSMNAFIGCTFSARINSIIVVDTDIERAKELKEWHSSEIVKQKI